MVLDSGCKPLAIVAGRSILGVAGVVDLPLIVGGGGWRLGAGLSFYGV